MYHSLQNANGLTLADLKEFIDKNLSDCGHLPLELTDETGEVTSCVSVIADEEGVTFYSF